MKGVWRVTTILGIPVQVHWSFALLFFWVYYEGYRNGLDWEATLIFGLLITALFLCVVLHEFGHALAARYYGVSTRDITLSPIGGMARLNRMPEKPFQEFIVALAGPVVNIVIALVLGLVLWFYAPHILPDIGNDYTSFFVKRSNFLPLLFMLNLFMAGFNMLPVFPMDGGRMFRALMSIRMGRVKATRVASIVGQVAAVIFLIFAIYMKGIIIGLISIFVFFMARQEYLMVRMESILDGQQIKQLIRGSFTKLQQTSSMQTAIDVFIKGMEKNFVVYNEWSQQCGVLTEKRILEAMQKKNADAPVQEYMSTAVVRLNSTDSLRTAYMKMQNPDHLIAVVFEQGTVAGVLDRSVLDNYLRIQQKL